MYFLIMIFGGVIGGIVALALQDSWASIRNAIRDRFNDVKEIHEEATGE